ncbi:MFS transporter [Paenarthrobacter sp. PH39-S1]|uniref:MFS transporter n=1 Tax=Paenarthrobacter sp. PH39-S1 TaxID=3046204 RepID=UPI0024B9E33F|nr:MFS transporter [Paenarthrobacter sp. PH39-S1]
MTSKSTRLRAGRPVKEDSLNTTAMRRILASSFVGSAIEFYDFVLYATAASLVFNKVFFANVPPAVGLFASFGTLAVGYAARPLGGAIFGHFGDRLGRKGCLIVSMVMMGLGTTAIGLLPKNLILGTLAGMSSYTVQGLMTVWAISYAVDHGVNQTGVLNVKAIGATLTIVGIWFAARLSDKYGRRPVMLTGMIAGAVLAYPILWLLQTNTLLGFAIGLFLANGIIQGVIFGPFGAYVAELFPTRIRYSGASMTYSLVLLVGGSLWLVGLAWALAFVVAAVCVMATKEGRDADLTGDMR